MKRRKACAIWLAVLLFGICGSSLRATIIYPFRIFPKRSPYYRSPDLNLYVGVSEGEAGQVDFTFHNKSSIDSCLSRVYFDDYVGSLLGIADITAGPGTSFSQHAFPRNLPGGRRLEPPFVTTRGFSADADPPRRHRGVNPGEWVQITFDLVNDGTFEGVISELDSGDLRIGVHIIDLPGCPGSVSAVTIPEPTMMALLGAGGVLMLISRRRTV